MIWRPLILSPGVCIHILPFTLLEENKIFFRNKKSSVFTTYKRLQTPFEIILPILPLQIGPPEIKKTSEVKE